MKSSPKTIFDFRMFLPLKPFFDRIYFGEVLIPATEGEQIVFDEILKRLKKYAPRAENNVDDKNNVLKNAQNLYDGREMIIDAIKNKLFPLASGNYYEEVEEESSKSKDKEKSEGEKIRKDNNRQINEPDKHYGSVLINKYFKEKSLMTIVNNLRNYRIGLPETQQEYNNLMVNLIVGLNKLSKDINDMPENEVEDMKLEALKNMIK